MERFTIDFWSEAMGCMCAPRVGEFGTCVGHGIEHRDEVVIPDEDIVVEPGDGFGFTAHCGGGFTGLDVFRAVSEAFAALHGGDIPRWLWIEGISYDPRTRTLVPVIGT